MRRFRAVLASFILAIPAFAQKPPAIELGFQSNRVYDFSSIDTVNAGNGNVIIDIPLGLRFPVSSHLSYGFKLVYNAKVWDYKVQEVNGTDYYWGKPNLRSNAGLGWRVSLGRLLAPSDPTVTSYRDGWDGWMYEGPAGDEHPFWSNAYQMPAPAHDKDADVQFTTDGSLLRMSTASGIGSDGSVTELRTLEFSDGSKQTFEFIANQWRLWKMADSFGNVVTVRYTVNTANRATSWTVTDPYGRQQTVNFVYRAELNDTVDNGMVVDTIQLSEPSSATGTPKPFKFNYVTNAVEYGCGHTYIRSPSLPGAPTGATVNLPLLDRIDLPDGTSYNFAAYTAGQSGCEQGMLQSLTLPTKGTIGYTYQSYVLVPAGCDPTGPQNSSPGIRTRSLDGALTSYLLTSSSDQTGIVPTRTPLPPCNPNDPAGDSGPEAPFRWRRTSVVSAPDAAGTHTRTDYYFNNWHPGAAAWWKDTSFATESSELLYGEAWTTAYPGLNEAAKAPQPIQPTTNASGNPIFDVSAREDSIASGESTRYLSEQFWDGCSSSGDCTNGALLRSVFRRQTSINVDQLGTAVARKVTSERTYYHDDSDEDGHTHCGGTCWTQVESSGFDNVGHFSSTVTTTNFPKPTDRARAATVVDTTGYHLFTGSEIRAASPWMFTTFSTRSHAVTNSQGVTASESSEAAFGAAGELLRMRSLKGAAEGPSDILTVLSYSDGKLSTESTYGGDSQSSLTSGTLASLPLPTTAVYRSDYGEAYGVVNSVAPSGVSFKSRDLDIDAKTGLVSTSRSTEGLATVYAYEKWGAIKTVTPPAEAAWNYAYTAATPTTPAQVKVSRDPDATRSDDDVSFILFYDRLGRLTKTQRTLPGAGCVEQEIFFDQRGRKISESVWRACGATAATSTFAYDAFARPTRVTSADGHVAISSYRGVRETVTTRQIGNASVSSMFEFDLAGRVVTVAENVDPLAPHTSGKETLYTYDVGGHLASVTQSQQHRYFLYDGRGFLVSEQHPEIGLAGNGTATYTYDARGHILSRTTAGAPLVSYEYDSAERLKAVYSGTNWLKGYQYDRDAFYPQNPDGAACPNSTCLGKVATTRRVQYDGSYVDESYSYDELSGRPRSRRTVLNSGIVAKFDLSQSYDQLGNITTLTYPSLVGSTSYAQTYGYTYGVLTRAGGSTISYLPSGLTDEVNHGGFVERTVADYWGLARPSELVATNIAKSSTLWRTGTFSFDGTGNVTSIGRTFYDYDAYARLIGWSTRETGGAHSTVSRAYDDYGNFLYDSFQSCGPSVGSVTHCATSSVVANQIVATTNRFAALSYDAEGNVTSEPVQGGSRHYSYEAGAMTRLIDPLMSLHFLYTADDERVAAVDDTRPNLQITYTLRGLDNRVLSIWRKDAGSSTPTRVEDELWRGALLLGRRTSTGLIEHYALDHLGSPRAVFSTSGSAIGTQDFAPFGQGGTSNGGALQFTGHERDAALLSGGSDSLPDYVHARYYAPSWARFASPDPVAPPTAIFSPQRWNRYSYAFNSPLQFIDPDGRCSFTQMDGSRYTDQNTLCAEAVARDPNRAAALYRASVADWNATMAYFDASRRRVVDAARGIASGVTPFTASFGPSLAFYAPFGGSVGVGVAHTLNRRGLNEGGLYLSKSHGINGVGALIGAQIWSVTVARGPLSELTKPGGRSFNVGLLFYGGSLSLADDWTPTSVTFGAGPQLGGTFTESFDSDTSVVTEAGVLDSLGLSHP